MIDWVNVALNALWILGLSTILAAFSYHHWLAGETSRRLRDVLAQPSWKLPFTVGMVLTCVGFGYGLAEPWWARTLWTALAIACGGHLVIVLRQSRKTAARCTAPNRGS